MRVRWNIWLVTCGFLYCRGLDDAQRGVTQDVVDEGDDDYEEIYEKPGYSYREPEYEVLSSHVAHRMHDKIDADGDGAISKKEIATFARDTRLAIVKKEYSGAIEGFDTDRNDKVDVPEFLQALFGSDVPGEEAEDLVGNKRGHMKEMKDLEVAKFRVADQNKDGFLSRDELLCALHPEIHDGVLEIVARATMKKRDIDGDGELTRKEFTEDDSDEFAGELGLHNFASVDADSSGKLSLQEVMAWESGSHHVDETVDHLFSHADGDDDNFLSKEELEGARESLANSAVTSEMLSWAEHHDLWSHHEL